MIFFISNTRLNKQKTNTNMTTTSTDFLTRLEEFKTAIKNNYPDPTSEEETEQIQASVESAEVAFTNNFQEFFENLLKHVEQQKETIRRLSNKSTTTINANNSSVASISIGDGVPNIDVPDIDWVRTNRKSKKEGKLNPYNIFTMAYSAQMGCRPVAHVWEKYDHKPWKILADNFNNQFAVTTPKNTGTGTSGAMISTGTTSVAPAKRTTAYNIWRKDQISQGKTVAKGDWGNQPKEVVKEYQDKLAALIHPA